MFVDGLSGLHSLEQMESIVRLIAFVDPEVTNYGGYTQR